MPPVSVDTSPPPSADRGSIPAEVAGTAPRVVRMHFGETTEAIRQRRQTVTRRLEPNFVHLKRGDIIEAVAEYWMLHCPIAVPIMVRLEVVSVRLEPLRRLTDDAVYGETESRLEGISPSVSVRARVSHIFYRHKASSLDTLIARIEFRYLPTPIGKT